MTEAALSPPARTPLLSNGVAAMLIFVAAEIMFFAALISAYLIVSAGFTNWPPPNQPRLPVSSTAFNTLVLLLSGVMIYKAGRSRAKSDPFPKTAKLLLAAILMGAFFVVFQGIEWVRLIHYGLTMTSSAYGSFFYLLIGAHALHAIAALLVLTLAYGRLKSDSLTSSFFGAAQVFWFFVVGVWPFLYVLVYLS